MGVRLKSLLGALVIIGTAIAVNAGAAIAQQATPTQARPRAIPQLVNDAFFSNDRDFYQNRSLFRQFNWILGQGSIIRNGFVENEIARDARAVSELSQNLLRLQASSDPILRTPDATNPFDTSLLLLPPYQADAIPPAVDVPFPLPPAPVSPPPRQAAPVPALW